MKWLKQYYYLLPVLLYLPSLLNFFSGDDWFHLRISQINNLSDFLNFFSFLPNDQTASFYRPLSTQVFFYVFQSLFKLNSFPYHLLGLFLLGYSTLLVFKISGSKMAAFIYSISVSNFTRVYFLSAYQELFLVIFSLLTLLNFVKKPGRSVWFFILAILSKETAVVLPALIILFHYKSLSKNFKTYLLIVCLDLIYLYFRLVYFGLASGDSYIWDFSLTKATNTLMWYILWSFGAPELLVDYVGSGLKLVPKFFTDYALWWKVIIYPLVGTIFTSFLLSLNKIKKLDLNLVKYVAFFLVSLSPVIFLPSHKFSLELGLPLVGFSLVIAWLIPKKLTLLSLSFLVLYVFLNISMNLLTHNRHYSISRGVISKNVYYFLSKNYSSYPKDSYFVFVNDAENYGDIWGQSKQISQAISSSDFFKVFYKDHGLKVHYEDFEDQRPPLLTPIKLSTKQFLTR